MNLILSEIDTDLESIDCHILNIKCITNLFTKLRAIVIYY